MFALKTLQTSAWRRIRLAALFSLLSASLLAVLAVGGRYVFEAQRGAAMPPLPPLSAVAAVAAPRFLFAINGVVRPLGVAVSPAGDRIYVTESDGPRETKVFDRDGALLGVLNPPQAAVAARLPVYVAVSPQDQVYVSDRRSGAVHIYSADGDYLGKLPGPDGGDSPWAPMALSFDGQANLLVTDLAQGRHGVALFAAGGAPLRQFGRQGSGDGEFQYPNGIATDQMGRIVVADSNNGRVVVLDGRGGPLWSFGRGAAGPSLGLPRGLAIDGQNRAYVVDTMNHVVLIFELGEREARLLFTIGGQGIQDGEFNFPNGLALDRSGRIYITDRENNRVQVWTY